jgi:hypothetical protein
MTKFLWRVSAVPAFLLTVAAFIPTWVFTGIFLPDIVWVFYLRKLEIPS